MSDNGVIESPPQAEASKGVKRVRDCENMARASVEGDLKDPESIARSGTGASESHHLPRAYRRV